MKSASIIIAAILFSASIALADIIYVPQDYPTIQAAVNAAQAGDTVQVAPGLYSPVSATYQNDITLLGSGMLGSDVTAIAGGGPTVSGIKVSYSSRWVIRGFEIFNVFQGVTLYYSDDIEVSETYVHDNYQTYSVGVAIEGCSNVYYHHNIIEQNYYSGIWELGTDNLRIYNNTIVYCFNNNPFYDANGIILISYVPNLEIVNNIIAFNEGDGVESTTSQYGSIITHNDVYGNGLSPWVNVTPGIGNIYLNPQFSGVPYQYSLLANSPCIDAGDPSIIDPDGTPSDIGALYFNQGGGGTGTVAITLTPLNPPIIIPASGGNVNFHVYIQNDSMGFAFFDGWTMLTLPDGQTTGPIVLRESLYLPAGGQKNRDMTLTVSSMSMPGVYTYTGYVGDYPSYIVDEDEFTFEKLASDNAEYGECQWVLSGWDYDEIITIPASCVPLTDRLVSIYPNPFNPETEVKFQLSDSRDISLKVYDITGRLAAELFNGNMSAGEHSVIWNAANQSSGMYFVALQSEGRTFTQKCLLLK